MPGRFREKGRAASLTKFSFSSASPLRRASYGESVPGIVRHSENGIENDRSGVFGQAQYSIN